MIGMMRCLALRLSQGGKKRGRRLFELSLFILLLIGLVLPVDIFGEETSITLGSVSISTYSPVSINGLEYSTNVYLTARNSGNQMATLVFTSAQEIVDNNRNWMTHFFAFFPVDPEGVEVSPGETVTLEFLLTNEAQVSTTLPFRFKIQETGAEGTLFLNVISSESPGFRDLSSSAAVTGKLTDSSGQALSNVEVRLYLFNGRESLNAQSDAQGNYQFSCPAVQEIEDALGSRPLPYHSLGYFLLVEKEDYVLWYRGEIKPGRGETLTADITLKAADGSNYKKKGELATNTAHGYWWLMPNADFSKLVAVQGRHPPMLDLPGHIVMSDLNGQEQWQVTTDDECWGFDASTNGLFAAGSHDGTVYMVNDSGSTLWTLNEGTMVREVEFSPDDRYLFTGPCDGNEAGLIEASSGRVIWSYSHSGTGQWLRNSRFSPDGKRIIAGFSGGRLDMLTDAGSVAWTRYIGEFPMVLEIDSQYNVYAAGKNRELFAYDASGDLRFRRRIANHVVTAGSNNMSADGSLIVFGTVGAMAIAVDSSGNILWQRPLSGNLQGHNAVDVTPDGEHIVFGTAGEQDLSGTVALFDKNGTLLWSHTSSDRRDTGEFAYAYGYDHNHRGAITVAVSDNVRHIAAGYGDSSIRIFEYDTAPSSLKATAVSSSQIDLSWKDNSNDETGFKVERKSSTSGSYSQISTVAAKGTSYSDTGLSASTTYSYRVKAYGASGDSNYSNEASATTSSAPSSGNNPSSGGDAGESGGGGGCFIATACYGTAMAEQVQVLSVFRDRYLMTNPLGRVFFEFYYEYSPSLARIIRRSEPLKKVVRQALDPLVRAISKIVND